MTKYYIGVDIGSVSVNGAVVTPEKKIIKDYYVRHKGHTFKAIIDLLQEITQVVDLSDVHALAFTGSGGKIVSNLLNLPFINEVVSFSEANSFLYPDVKSVIEIGGEDARFISLAYDASLRRTVISDFAMNSLCAAGTGSFLDQQASRLGISIEDFGQVALRSENPATVAGRCSTFAKTDMIHLQQIATPTEDIAAGLCYALVRNFLSTIAKGKNLEKVISFQGGVAANNGVIKAFEKRIGLDEGELFVPSNHGTLGAIGTALVSIDKGFSRMPFSRIEQIQDKLVNPDMIKTNLESLSSKRSSGSSKEETPLTTIGEGKMVDAFLGIDIGSISTNLVVTDKEGRVIQKRYLMTAGKPIEAVRQGLHSIGEQISDQIHIKGVCTTGSGRHMIAKIIGADLVKNEITAQARAAIEHNKAVDTIFEIGGQDSKYISIKDGVVIDFEMNKVCAAGTGSFLEEQAERLNINIKEEFSKLALRSKNPVELGERCTVFMNTNIGHFQALGTSPEDIAAGLCYSIVFNYLNRVVRGKKVGDTIFFQGGVAFNRGVIAAFEKVVGKKMIIPPHHEVTGAIGCALMARDHVSGPSHFKGFDIANKEYQNRLFICKDCVNRCEVNELIIKGEPPLYFGSRCGKYDVAEKSLSSDVPDLFHEREQWLLENHIRKTADEKGDKLKIGIPRAMVAFFEFFPFWNTFFQALNCDVILSTSTNRNIIRRGLESAISDYCFPIKVTHGHILNLVDKNVDYIFLPHIIDLERDRYSKNTFMCPYVQSLPDIMEASLGLKEKDVQLLKPSLHYRRGRKHIERVLLGLGRRIHSSDKKIKKAIQEADAQQRRFIERTKARGSEVIRNLKEGQQAVVIIGRLYNTCDYALNLEITQRFREKNVTAIPIDFLPLDDINIADRFPDMYWHPGIRILRAAKFIIDHQKLYGVYLTNFGCGPDSFILSFFYRLMERKPFLEIEVDEHSADAGVLTRCEAFLDSLENIKKL
jgi:predicted CoA-substrate-specific enzyme activase